MKKFLLPQEGSFYKANLHCHTTLSDGALSPEEVKELYKSLGYSIVAFTDHDIFIPHPELCDDNFLALNGFEIETDGDFPDGKNNYSFIKTCHFCCIALDAEARTQPCWHREKYLKGNAAKQRDRIVFDESLPDYERSYTGEGISDHMKRAKEAGFFVTYNHPTWSGESYPEYMSYHGMHAMEMFNGSCNCSGFEDCNPRVYDDMLKGGERIYCIGADDNHNNPSRKGTKLYDSGWAFTVIKSASLNYSSVSSALLSGHFYASEGPSINELWYEDGFVHISCSDAYRINYNSGRRNVHTKICEDGEALTEAHFPVYYDDGYFRITVIGKDGKRACTNAYFTDTL